MIEVVYLGLGSNLGDKKQFLDQAIEKLNALDHASVDAVSEYFVTRAVTAIPQPDFLNAVCRLQTIYSPHELLAVTQAIEKECGRGGKGQYDPRTLDIDILFYGQHIVSDDNLVIPHPMLHLRGFVLAPLNQIAPDFVHPMLQENVKDLFDSYMRLYED